MPGRFPDLLSPADLHPPPARDWAMYPAVLQVDSGVDVFALGDVHGDYDTAAKLLAAKRSSPRFRPIHECHVDSRYVHPGLHRRSHRQVHPELAARLHDGAPGAQRQRQAGKSSSRWAITRPSFGRPGTIFNTKAAAFVAELQAAGIAPEDVGAAKNACGVFFALLPFAARVRDWFFSHAGNTAGREHGQAHPRSSDGVDAYGFSAPVLASTDSILKPGCRALHLVGAARARSKRSWYLLDGTGRGSHRGRPPAGQGVLFRRNQPQCRRDVPEVWTHLPHR